MMESLHAIAENPHTWVYLGFFIFVVAAGPRIWRALAGMLDQRALKIKSDLDMAQKLRDEAQALLGEYQRKQKDAAQDSQRIVASAQEMAERQIADSRRKLEQMLARREKMALEKIQQAETQAVADVRREAIDVATRAAERLIAQQMTDERSGRMVDQEISELSRRSH
jgi:F-type H+-transporting ATPase subunit b